MSYLKVTHLPSHLKITNSMRHRMFRVARDSDAALRRIHSSMLRRLLHTHTQSLKRLSLVVKRKLQVHTHTQSLKRLSLVVKRKLQEV